MSVQSVKPAKCVLYLSIFVTKFVTFVSNENVVLFGSVLLFWCSGTSLLNYLSAKRKLTPQEINLNSLDMLRSGINTVRKILYTHGKEIRAIWCMIKLSFSSTIHAHHTKTWATVHFVEITLSICPAVKNWNICLLQRNWHPQLLSLYLLLPSSLYLNSICW